MKIVEKLSEESAHNRTGTNPYPNTDADRLWYMENRGHREGFEAGFRKALDLIDGVCLQFKLPEAFHRRIREIADQEVPE